jgi:hypothetical protein
MRKLIKPIKLDALPGNPQERLRVFTDAFGELIFNLIDYAVQGSRNLIVEESVRTRVGRILAEPFLYAANNFTGEQQDVVLKICRYTAETYADLFISYLEHTGSELVLDEKHVAQFKLVLEIVDREDQVVGEEILNKGRKSLAAQFFRWKRLHNENGQQTP